MGSGGDYNEYSWGQSEGISKDCRSECQKQMELWLEEEG